jgi:hypothetical protein
VHVLRLPDDPRWAIRAAGSSKNVPYLKNSLSHDALTKTVSSSEEPKINVVKRSSVSTGQLKRLLALHRQPINLVVFQGTLES